MKLFPTLFVALLWASVMFFATCASKREDDSQTRGKNPLQTLNRLLELHGLSGKQPEERTEEAKSRMVTRADLAPLVGDLDNYDSFLSNLYVGFIVGVVARHQTRLYVSTTGDRADVTAGKAQVVLYLDDGNYRISLKDSIPPEIVQRAELEKRKIDSSRE